MLSAVSGDHADLQRELFLDAESHAEHQDLDASKHGLGTQVVVDTHLEERVAEIIRAMDTNRNGSLSAIEVKKTLADMLEVRPGEIPDDHEDLLLWVGLEGLTEGEQVRRVLDSMEVSLIDQERAISL